MDTNVTFRHFNAQHPELKELASDSLNKLLRFHDRIISGSVVFSNDTEKKVEMKIHISGNDLIVSDKGEDFKKILHDLTDTMARRVKKLKSKIRA
jgi:ribosomal subunit interface protein